MGRGIIHEPDNIQPDNPPANRELLALLEKGETPPGIRTDVSDLPPDPRQVPSTSRRILPAKHWSERASLRGGTDEEDPVEVEGEAWRPPSPPLPDEKKASTKIFVDKRERVGYHLRRHS